jgi:hypothetical protein
VKKLIVIAIAAAAASMIYRLLNSEYKPPAR